jgi:hypothetical protein
MSLTDFEKSIYNNFLATTKSLKKQPFKLRKDFTNLDDKSYVCLKKLSQLFNNNRQIIQSEYFSAPYIYYGVDNYFELSFFLTPKAIKCYTQYKRKQELSDPDNEEVINECKKCCKFIYNYCKDNNISLNEYKSNINGTTPLVIQHLKNHDINFYTLHALDCDKVLNSIEPEVLDFIVTNFYNLLNQTRINFQKSKVLKTKIREALILVDRLLLKNKTQIL